MIPNIIFLHIPLVKLGERAVLGNLSSHRLGTAFCSSDWPDTLKLPYVTEFFLIITSASTFTSLATLKTGSGFLQNVGTFDHYMVHKPKCKTTCICLCTHEHLCPCSLQMCIGIHVLQACTVLIMLDFSIFGGVQETTKY